MFKYLFKSRAKAPASSIQITNENFALLKEIVQSFLQAYTDMLSPLRVAESRSSSSSLPSSSLPFSISHLCLRVFEREEEITKDNVTRWRGEFRIALQVNESTDHTYDALIETLNEANAKLTLSDHDQINIHNCFRDFLDVHNPAYRRPKVLDAIARLTKFTDASTPVLETVLPSLLNDMQMVCDETRSSVTSETFTEAHEKAEMCRDQLNAMLNPPERLSETRRSSLHNIEENSLPTENTLPLTLAQPAGLNIEASLKAGYNITVVTFNVNNQNPHKNAVEELTAAMFEKESNPDIIVIALQEAKPSWSLRDKRSLWYGQGEDLAVRALKRRKSNVGTELYSIAHNDRALAITHPLNPANLFHHSRMHLVVAYKKTNFLPHQINIINHGQVVTNDRENKGGLYATLSVHDRKIAVIGVHLNSFDPDIAKQQAEALISTAHNNQTLDGVIIAGDFNTRFAPNVLAFNTKEDSRKANRTSVIKAGLSLPDAIKTSVNQWKENSQSLKNLTFVTLPDATYGHQKETHTPNPERDHLFDYGGLDHVAIENYGNSNALKFSTEIAQIARPRAPTLLNSRPNEISDHAAVIAQVTLTCLERRNTNMHQLDSIHASLGEKNCPELFRDYFEYAIAATAPVDNHDLPYHLANTELIKRDITFIINHLYALCDQDFDIALYNRLIFGTCEKISRFTNDNGIFIKEKFDQLLYANTGSDKLKKHLLKPFRIWLDSQRDQHNRTDLPRECYTFDKNGSLKKLGFFHGTARPNTLDLSPKELAELR